MSNTTVTNAIRTALKVAGFNARQVSVKDRSYGDIKVTVRDVTVAISKVEAICASFENVRRCEGSGEILLGGNTYVEVRYADDVVAPVTAAVAAIIRSAQPGVQVQLAGGYTASHYADSPWRDEVRAHGPGFDDHVGLICCGIDHAAKQIAVKYLDNRALATAQAATVAA